MGIDGWIELFATYLSIRSPGASQFYRKTDDGSRLKIVPARVHCTKHENISRRRHDFRRYQWPPYAALTLIIDASGLLVFRDSANSDKHKAIRY